MFKKVLIAAALASSFGASAHSQVPKTFEKFVATEKVRVPITVQNINSYPQSYELFVDDKKLGEISLAAGEKRRFPVVVVVDEKDKWIEKEISTRSIPKESDTVITHIFTGVKLYRPTLKSDKQ